MNLVEILTAGAGGGLFGVLGQVGNRAIGIWEAKEKRKELVLVHAQEERRWAHEATLLDLQAKARAEETEGELALVEARGTWDGLAASHAAEAAIGKSYPWVEAVRGMTRPTLTLLSLIGLALVYFTDAGRRPDLQSTIVDTVVFLASATTVWWFGDRAPRRATK